MYPACLRIRMEFVSLLLICAAAAATPSPAEMDLITPDEMDLVELRQRLVNFAEPQHAQCPPDQVLEALQADLAKAYQLHKPYYGAYMSLHDQLRSDMELDFWTLQHLQDALLLKMVHEYALGAYDEMTATLLCLFEYCVIYAGKSTQTEWGTRWILQRNLYDVVYVLDLLRFIETKAGSTLYGLLLKQAEERQLTAVLLNDCIPHMGAFFYGTFGSGNFLIRSTGKIYGSSFFKQRETNHIMEYAQYLRRCLEEGKCLNDYEAYTLTGGSWMPGRIYAQKMIKIWEHTLKCEYTLKNTARILLWTLLVYAHKDNTGAYPNSLLEITPEVLPEAQTAGRPAPNSLVTGMPLIYELGSDTFTINGGPEYRSLSGQGGKPVGETIYVGCITDKD